MRWTSMEIDRPTPILYTVRPMPFWVEMKQPQSWFRPLPVDVYNLVGRWVEMVHGKQVPTDIYRYEWAGESR
jgi:hypothetical protein